MNTITISQYLSIPESSRPSVRYRNQIVDSIYLGRNEGSYVISVGAIHHGSKREDTILEVWDEQDVREKLVVVQDELAYTYFDVYQEYESARRERTGDWEEKYWQGKKDGMRIALAALNELMPDDHDWQGLQESSQKGRSTELQILRSQVNDAIRILSDIETDGLDRYNKAQINNYRKWIENCKNDFGFTYGETP
jgi:DNA repair ATPase RecN